MRDLVIVAITGAFFVVCAAYVRWCDRIIGPDRDPDEDRRDALTLASPDTEARRR